MPLGREQVDGLFASFEDERLARQQSAAGGPVIRLGPDLTAAARAAEQAMVDAGLPLFRRGDTLVRPLILDARGLNDKPIKTVGLAQVPPILMRSFMEQAARFEKYDAAHQEVETVPSRPTMWPN